ncbi:hypothetical protein RCG19_07875 [Neobacillus sp. OS1-2]|uniref:hypothetical protein n=1 Tax=Neobacillus sp. OS1-2 TaxID=3070680 RepID=UPI0027E0F049|nr:hypothetical protein [Neobacillus sp. OS1-2]WML41557.1 hypothetical protein RCG19_07875 [Neobacillus sp. OS1-2]
MESMIVDMKTGKSVDVCFRELDISDVRKFGLTTSNGWFHWEKEFKNELNRVFGLFMLGNNKDIQGVIAIQEWDHSQMVHIALMESAPHNQFNYPNQQYAAVGKNLLSFAMTYSLSIPSFEGFVGLMAKKNYNEEYYTKLQAEISNYIDGRPYYYFETSFSNSLAKHYLPGGVTICPN